jgi:hypothetical protein
MKTLPTMIMIMSLVVACSLDKPTEAPRDAARRVADSYLESKSWQDPNKSVGVRDDGGKWLVVYYDEPVDANGGEFYVWVDKHTMKVVGTAAAQ